MFQVRGVVNQKLEEARNGKLIGASLEAKVYLHASSPKLQEELISMCGSNDVDHLKRIFLTSQVSLNFSHNFEGDLDPSENSLYQAFFCIFSSRVHLHEFEKKTRSRAFYFASQISLQIRKPYLYLAYCFQD